MGRKTRSGLLAALAIVALTLPAWTGLAAAAAPPIDCRHVRGAADRAICGSPEDVALDQEVTALYNRGMASLSGDERHGLAQHQLSYLRKRAGCAWASHHSAHPGTAVIECVSAVMSERLHLLRSVVDRSGR